MNVFVFSFGTIEIVEGILVIDSQITYKTFEKEYNEILKTFDKSIKTYIRNAFEKGEYEIKNAKIEASLSVLFKTLEDYDKPNFNFAGDSPASIEGVQSSKPIEPAEAASSEEPDIIAPQRGAEALPPQPAIEEEVLPDSAEKVEEAEPLAQPSGTQDARAPIEEEADSEEPEVIEASAEEPEAIEEPQVLAVKKKPEGIQSNFIVQLMEHADFQLDHKQTIQDAKITGKLLLKNTGKKDRIWDINLFLEKIEETSLKEDTLHINELNPGTTSEHAYNVKSTEKIPLNFREHINTFTKGSEEIHTLIFNQASMVEFTFFLENPTDHAITNLTLTKTFPKIFTDLKVLSKVPPDTKIRMQDQSLIWEGVSLKPTQSITLKVQVKVLPKKLDALKTGPIEIKFNTENNLYTPLLVKDITSISNNMYYIEKDEKEQLPNNWACRFIFENKSEFPILLENAEIYAGDIDTAQKETVFRAINEVIQPNEEEWISKEWDLVSTDIPTFGKRVKFKIIPITTKSFTANFLIDEIELPILWATCEKTYSLSEIASYLDTGVDVKTIITSEGDAGISELKIKEIIPENFKPPPLNELKFFLNGNPLTPQNKKFEIQIQKEPNTDEPDVLHKLTIEFLHLQDSIGAITKGSKLELQYSITAIKPPPEKVYTFPITLTLNTSPPGAPLEISSAMVKNSEIKVTHRRRKLTIGKSVSPGAEDGEFEIAMVFKNRGNTPI
ncbi:MAG: hypothetical protein LUQ65_01040, partial [Candidatus Helarchaeota archaeon]|nr:hypothetical protein [Candidatus Helarchaeota archaeon]